MNKKLRNSLIALIGIIVVLFVCYVGLKILRFRDPTFTARSFDQQLWLKGNLRDRGEMVQNLQDSNILSNLSEKQLYELLGPPDKNNVYGEIYYMVDVGRLIFGRMFPEQLYIVFDKNRRVSKYGRVD